MSRGVLNSRRRPRSRRLRYYRVLRLSNCYVAELGTEGERVSLINALRGDIALTRTKDCTRVG
jgi:hypothetical protein